MSILVKKAGLHDTFQDIGRIGFRQYGVPQSGVMDIWSHQCANWLVGNDKDIPTIEITQLGGVYQFLVDAIIGCVGAEINMTLNGQSIEKNTNHWVKSGDVLKMGFAKKGLRAYLAIQGQPAFEPVFKSFSTYTYGQFGGWKGRVFKKNDEIKWKNKGLSFEKKVVPEQFQRIFENNPIIRIVKSIEWDWLSKTSQNELTSQFYKITNDSNRMGIRLNSEPLFQKEKHKMISSGTNLGTIQLLPNGQLIVLMNDGQTTGGYPRVGNVIQADLARLAQVPANNKIRFKIIDLEEAQQVFYYKTEQLKHFLK